MNIPNIPKNTKITFKQRPLAISSSYRIHIKVALIVLILKINSKKSQASILKIQFFIWAVSKDEHKNMVRDLISSEFNSKIEFWGLETALLRALDYALAENIVSIAGKYYKLESKGEQYFNLLEKEESEINNEIVFLRIIGKKISEEKLSNMAKWITQNAEN